MSPSSSSARSFAALIALLAWSALVLQYGLLVGSTRHGGGPLLATLRYFSFFTILSNLLVALTTSAAVGWPQSRLASPRVRGAAALCIAVTCGVYYFVLARTWAPHGAQLLANVALHYLVPPLYLAWWITCVPHGRLAWADALRWLLLPLGFLGWTLARGAWLHEYPYPFVDVDVLGIGEVLRNALALGVLFLLVGLVLVALDQARHRRG
ncbi:MAG: hypothetical protein GXC76_00615 [Rhodanobacteraceae bacterium]|jgi:hypothetical protein|nr:hypothetical protein [Rhodanobacteraceae bacterium]